MSEPTWRQVAASRVTNGAQGRHGSSAPASRFATRQNVPPRAVLTAPAAARMIRATAGIGWAAGRLDRWWRKLRRRRRGPLRDVLRHPETRRSRSAGSDEPGRPGDSPSASIGRPGDVASSSPGPCRPGRVGPTLSAVTHRSEKCCRSVTSDGAADSSRDGRTCPAAEPMPAVVRTYGRRRRDRKASAEAAFFHGAKREARVAQADTASATRTRRVETRVWPTRLQPER
jgi:hypothetical protein